MNGNASHRDEPGFSDPASPPGISRRTLLGQTGLIGASLLAAGTSAVAAEVSSKSPDTQPANKKLKVIVAGGHPGDPEYGCGGVVARFTDLGHEVVLLYLNQGDPAATATRPASDVRVKEAAKACEILKARPLFAGHVDGHAIIDNAHYDAFGKLLSVEAPDAVFTQWPIDNHRDHRATALLAYDAWKQSGHKFALYYYEVSNGEDTLQFAPTHYADITDVEPRKQAACYAHASQAPGRFYRLQDQVAAFRGLESGHKRAEAFILQLQSPFDVLAELIG
jgi:LmbE family N-acetylglucosaminyl deacetylase